MAEYLASIFGTEKDKVNCSFFFKTGRISVFSASERLVSSDIIQPFQEHALMETGAAEFTTSPPSLRRCSCPTCTSTLRTPPRLRTAHTWPMSRTRRCRNTTTASSRISLWSARTSMDRCDINIYNQSEQYEN